MEAQASSTRVVEEERRIKLSQIKHGIYNTYLPSWRTIDMDDKLGKLCDEHSRTSLPAGIDLPEEIFYQYNAPSYYIPNYEVLPLYFLQWREDKMAEKLSFLNNPELGERWKQFKKYLPLGMYRVEHIPQIKDFHFCNYHVRYLKAEARNSFKKYPSKDLGIRHLTGVVKNKDIKKYEPIDREKCGSAICTRD